MKSVVTGETLKSCSYGGEEGADEDDPLVRPGQPGHHQPATDTGTKPDNTPSINSVRVVVPDSVWGEPHI